MDEPIQAVARLEGWTVYHSPIVPGVEVVAAFRPLADGGGEVETHALRPGETVEVVTRLEPVNEGGGWWLRPHTRTVTVPG